MEQESVDDGFGIKSFADPGDDEFGSQSFSSEVQLGQPPTNGPIFSYDPNHEGDPKFSGRVGSGFFLGTPLICDKCDQRHI